MKEYTLHISFFAEDDDAAIEEAKRRAQADYRDSDGLYTEGPSEPFVLSIAWDWADQFFYRDEDDQRMMLQDHRMTNQQRAARGYPQG